MSYAWSANAPQILSLFRPWREGDGCSEDWLATAERALGLRFPQPLRGFYRDWAERDDLGRRSERLLRPQEVFVRSDAAVFCVENQGVSFWAVRREDLDRDDPPVHVAYNEGDDLQWVRSHERLSGFLDALTFHHALGGGAVHGGVSREYAEPRIVALVKRHWRAVELDSQPWGLVPDAGFPNWVVYFGEGEAISLGGAVLVGARTAEQVERIRRTLGLTWRRTW